MDENKITYFAETDSRNRRVRFGIKAKDRTRHIYVIGKTGMGKSTLLENMAVQDIQSGEGMAIIDPHGGTARKLLEYIPQHRVKDVIFFNPADLENPISFNVLEDVDPDKRHFVAAGLMNTFKKIWQDAWSARMEYILGNTLLALLEFPGATLLSVNKMLSDKEYRKLVVENVKDPSVKSFWVDEFAKYTEKFAAEATPAIQNKIGQFTSNPLIRNLIGQPQSSFDFRKVMDDKKILIINLSKGELGPDNVRLIGGMIVTKIYLAAMSRANVSAARLKEAPPFYFYVDEFQNFANESFAEILSEARKYKLALTVANQYIEQMTEEVRSAVIGNVGSMILFRIGSTDAIILEKEFDPEFTPEDMVNLGFAQCYLKLMIDGVTSRPFSATTLPPIVQPQVNYKNDVIEWSRRQFSKPRQEVEKAIHEWYGDLANKSKKPDERKGMPISPPVSKFVNKPNPMPPPVAKPYVSPYKSPQAPSMSAQPIRQPESKPFVSPKPKVEEPLPEEDKDDFIPLNKLKVAVPPVVKSGEKTIPPIFNNKPNFGGKKANQESMSGLKSLLQSVMKNNNQNQNVKPVKAEGNKLDLNNKQATLRSVLRNEGISKIIKPETKNNNEVDNKEFRINGKPYKELKFEFGHLLARKNGGFATDTFEDENQKEIPKDVLQRILKVDK
ncbi:MAG: type IV secretion system DNA-binding domain-containing protein [Minisyncoccia bacterium]